MQQSLAGVHRCAWVVLALAGSAIAQPDAGTGEGEIARFDGHRIVRVEVATVRDFRIALALTDDVWSHHVQLGGHADVRMTPEQFAALVDAGVPHEVLIADVQAAIDAESAEVLARRQMDLAWYENYHTYAQIQAYCEQLAAAHPNLAQVINVGASVQGRQIFALRITAPGGSGSRPGVLYNAAQHAREWATPPTAVYLAEMLLTRYGTDPTVTRLVDEMEFYIVPIVNPDGYVYTWTNNRLWRKNRSLAPAGGCRGVDLNRNWGHEWGGVGASTSSCNDTYRGPAPFSEPETQALRDFTLARPNIVAHLDIHSYSQLVLSPWGYTGDPAPDNEWFLAANQRMVDAIFSAFGSVYQHGPIFTAIYPASGTSVDWMYGARAIKSFTTEVRDTGQTGFLLPAAQILPNAQENFLAEIELARSVAPCYANCDQSTTQPLLNVADFTCFLQKFAGGDAYANCDGSTAPPVLNVADFTCFLQKFAAGCP